MRRWLIRNSSSKILGPITKTLVIDLLNKGLVKDEDEVTSGNGHWFYLWEKEYVKRYIFGDEEQDFNPVSSTKSVLILNEAMPESIGKTMVLNIKSIEGQQKNVDEDVKRFTSMELDEKSQIAKKNEDDDVKFPDNDDLAFPDAVVVGESSKIGTSARPSLPRLEISKDETRSGSGSTNIRINARNINKKTKDDRFLFIILYGVSFVLLVILVQFIRIIIGK